MRRTDTSDILRYHRYGGSRGRMSMAAKDIEAMCNEKAAEWSGEEHRNSLVRLKVKAWRRAEDMDNLT